MAEEQGQLRGSWGNQKPKQRIELREGLPSLRVLTFVLSSTYRRTDYSSGERDPTRLPPVVATMRGTSRGRHRMAKVTGIEGEGIPEGVSSQTIFPGKLKVAT